MIIRCIRVLRFDPIATNIHLSRYIPVPDFNDKHDVVESRDYGHGPVTIEPCLDRKVA